MAKDFAGINRLEHEAGMQAPEAGSKGELVKKSVKAWESKAARRAAKGGFTATSVLALAACDDDSGTVASLTASLAAAEESLIAAQAAEKAASDQNEVLSAQNGDLNGTVSSLTDELATAGESLSAAQAAEQAASDQNEVLSAQNSDLEGRLNPTVDVVSGEVAGPATLPDTFKMDVSEGGEFEIAGFDASEDTVEITGLPGADGATLAELVGDDGLDGELILVQPNPFDGSLLVNFGFDSLGDVVSLTIQDAATADLDSISVSLVSADEDAAGGDDGDTTGDDGDAAAGGGDTTGDDGGDDAIVPLEVSSGAAVEGTDAAEEFTITASAADGGQFEINSFDVTNDSITLSGLTDVVADTLADLQGQQGFGGEVISVQDNPFAGSQFVNLGFDSSGEVISFELGGVTQDDLSAVAVSIA